MVFIILYIITEENTMTRIFTDMCSDLPEHLAKRYDISVIPMTYTLGGRDRVLSYQNNDPAGFMQRCAQAPCPRPAR